MPNPFSPLDRLEFDFELPSLPGPLARVDRWFNRLSETQRIGVALLGMLFLAASGFYLLGLGSTVLVNRAEAAIAAREAELAALPTPEPMVTEATPTATPSTVIAATSVATPRPTQAVRPTQITEFPTPIPAQLLPTIPIQPPAQRSIAPAEAPRPRFVAPPEPPTPTPPVRVAPQTTKPVLPATGTGNAPARSGTPTPALPAPIVRTPTPAPGRPAATAAPATKPSQPVLAPKPTTAPVIQNPISNPAAKPTAAPTPRPASR